MDDNHTTATRRIKSLELIAAIAILLSIIITCLVYSPGIAGIFTLDDTTTLTLLNKFGGITDLGKLTQFLSDGVGILGRPMSMLSFLIDDQYYPGDPSQYRYTNLMTHLLCGMFLMLFVKHVFELKNLKANHIIFLTVMVPAYWLIHPLNVSTTLYIVQRMTLLMSLFVLVGLTIYTYGRKTVISKQYVGIAILTTAVIIFGTLAALSKENGALICVYILVLETTLFKEIPRPTLFKYWLYLFIVLPIVVMFGYLIYNLDALSIPYHQRDFTLLERLLTECRILITYLYQITIPPSGGTGLYHDDFVVSTSLFSPITTLFSFLTIIGLVYIAVRFRKKQPVISFAIFWFFGGHVLESTVLPLELYFEHRNYLPMLGPLIGIMFYLYKFAVAQKNLQQRKLILSLPILLLFLSSIFTFQSAKIWGTPDLMYVTWYKEHPNSLRASTMYATFLEKNGKYSEAIDILNNTYHKHPDTVALPLYALKISCSSNVPPAIRVIDVIQASSHAKYRGILTQVIQQLINTIHKATCPYIKMEDVISILTALEKSDKIANPTMANLLFILSDLYVQKGLLTPAVETLDRAFQKQRIPTYALRQAELLSSAGLYQDALDYIEKAKQANSVRQIFKPSELDVILKMQSMIVNRMNSRAK